MPTRKILHSVLQGFLGTFRSRYSDHGGYWIFGLVISEIETKTIDLLANDVDHQPAAILTPLARLRFREQIDKHHVPIAYVRSAQLELRRVGELGRPAIDLYSADGYELSMTVRVTTDLGKTHAKEAKIFAAPHDPKRETRSTRRGTEQ